MKEQQLADHPWPILVYGLICSPARQNWHTIADLDDSVMPLSCGWRNFRCINRYLLHRIHAGSEISEVVQTSFWMNLMILTIVLRSYFRLARSALVVMRKVRSTISTVRC